MSKLFVAENLSYIIEIGEEGKLNIKNSGDVLVTFTGSEILLPMGIGPIVEKRIVQKLKEDGFFGENPPDDILLGFSRPLRRLRLMVKTRKHSRKIKAIIDRFDEQIMGILKSPGSFDLEEMEKLFKLFDRIWKVENPLEIFEIMLGITSTASRLISKKK